MFIRLLVLYLIHGSRYVISVPVRICDSIECSSMCKELIQNLSNRTLRALCLPFTGIVCAWLQTASSTDWDFSTHFSLQKSLSWKKEVKWGVAKRLREVVPAHKLGRVVRESHGH